VVAVEPAEVTEPEEVALGGKNTCSFSITEETPLDRIREFSLEIVAFVKKYAWLNEGNVVNYLIEGSKRERISFV